MRKLDNDMEILKHIELRFTNPAQTWSIGIVAGLAGGVAEIFWIAIYERLSGGEAAAVARGVTEALFPKLVAPATAVPLGIAIHMVLAVMLGVAVAVLARTLLPRKTPAVLEFIAVVGSLVCVWAINFLLILPAINPAFVAIVPYTASLASKVFFGVAAALALKFSHDPTRPRGGIKKEVSNVQGNDTASPPNIRCSRNDCFGLGVR